MLQFDYDAVILADGNFPVADVPLRLLREAPYVVCCDGASRHWPQCDAIVGDGDSVPDELRHRLIQVDEQDDNDLTKATRHCISRGLRRIVYLGATGRREDHTLGNISLIARYHQDFGLSVLMATDYGWFVPAYATCVFNSVSGQQVSLFNVSCRQLTSKGLKWDAYPYQQLWQGTLNEALGETFTIEADGEYLIFRTYEVNRAL